MVEVSVQKQEASVQAHAVSQGMSSVFLHLLPQPQQTPSCTVTVTSLTDPPIQMLISSGKTLYFFCFGVHQDYMDQQGLTLSILALS